MRLRFCSLLLVSGALAFAESPAGQFKAQLSGFNQVPPVLTAASGAVSAEFDETANTVQVTLTWSGLVGVAQSAQLHFGQKGVNGNIIAFLCGGGKPACPINEGTLSATITPSDVKVIPGQGIAAGDFEALLLAIRQGAVYVNVYTDKFTAGEIRGQLGRGMGKNKNKEPGNRKDKEDIE